MKRKGLAVPAAILAISMLVQSGCDWTTNGTSLNTSQGAGVNVNFSGVYHGNISGRVVDRTSKGTIAWLTIRQTGNRIEVIDSQGSKYEGVVGSPGIVAEPFNDVYPAGAELMQAQISFKGKDGVAQRDIEFVGIIHAISVTDIRGDSRTNYVGSSSANLSGITNNIQTYITTNYIGERKVILREYEPGTTNVISQTEYTLEPEGTHETIFESYKNNRARENNSASVTETTFRLNEANVQYRLEGTWIEKNSPIVSRVDAISRGTFGVITISRRGQQEAPNTFGGAGGS